jgi:hypothetical protein
MLRILADWIWPTLAPLPDSYLPTLQARVAQEVAAQDAACAKDPEASSRWLQYELDEFKEEQGRTERTRTTLRAMLGVAAVAMTGALALAGWLMTRLTTEPKKGFELTDFSFAAFMAMGIYVTLQVVAILRCVIRGLQVRSFETMPHPVRHAGEAAEAFDRRKASAVRWANFANTEQTNDAVSWKKVALVAWRNFLMGVGLLLLAILGAIGFAAYS